MLWSGPWSQLKSFILLYYLELIQVQFRHQALSIHPAPQKTLIIAYLDHQVYVKVSKISSVNLISIKMWLACEVCFSLAIITHVKRLLGEGLGLYIWSQMVEIAKCLWGVELFEYVQKGYLSKELTCMCKHLKLWYRKQWSWFRDIY